MNRRRSRRQVAANLALGAAVLMLAWSMWLALAGGFDTRLFGIRIRSNDALRTAIYAVLAFAAYALLRYQPARRAGGQAWTSSIRAALPLVLVLAVAALVRVWGITFGLPHLICRPDEDAVNNIALGLFSGGLNPGYFTYPPLFMLTVAGTLRVIEVAQFALAEINLAPGIVIEASVTQYMVARLLSAAAGVATVAVVYRTGTRLFGRRAGLAGAACLALAFLHVRDSHFGVTDVPMTFMLAVSFLWIVRLSVSGRSSDLVEAAVIVGLAMATKYNAALVQYQRPSRCSPIPQAGHSPRA